MSSASLDPLDLGRPRSGRRAPASTSFQDRLGLDARITKLNLAAFLAHCSSSILFLVFLNAAQPFVIQQLGQACHRDDAPADSRKVGALSGTLIFSDELLSTFLAPLWGAVADLFGFHRVVPIAYVFVAIGLLVFTAPSQPWPGLLLARLVFAVGGSGVTAMLSAILTAYSHRQSEGPNPSANAPQQPADRAEPPASTEPAPPRSDAALDGPEAVAAGQPKQSRRRSRHGRLAALAGVFTGFGALLAVFGLLRLPQALAKYFDQQEGRHHRGSTGDVGIRRATTATFVIAAAFAFMIAGIMALGLRSPEDKPAGLSRERRLAARVQADADDYGALQDSTITILSDSRAARRTRLRQRQQRREMTGWLAVAKRTLGAFARSSAGGFRLIGPVRPRVGLTTEGYRSRVQAASELRMAYLGGALARACTIGTTAFLPLLIAQHYYTSGLCNTLPSPDPRAPLPPDEIKKLCRQAFTATAILGGTIQLTALMLSPIIGLLCDWLTPTVTLSLTSASGAAGFLLLGLGPNGLRGNSKTGEEVPNPLSTLSILAAMAIGFGQIGAIVASLSGCARARSHLLDCEDEDERRALATSDEPPEQDDPQQNGREHPRETERLLTRRSRRSASAARTDGPKPAAGPLGSAGSIAGAYTCCGSIAILVVSKLGGALFDLFAPGPFLLIAGLSAFVTLLGLSTTLLGIVADRRRR
ncbi:uncharacterized protein PFL1_00447 [Pseudozyma flocculosa PF-1]|uniref:Major facilitator superfamily (MFS) profile domain-containing protein n=1 Tax=Pseudozyma flocculosa TaxID=84751 RepID=A0A5C3EUL7_9BASI|nr:uncharacterized protein PFL1_00447 [Pseudozyma flocculosa PF-1]EPQ32250.1 hypothetical protein PFL1_00447 [Pseudozyma flocculosa PF-1]SPO34799.1 uncharacterized protein PSFLO_00270 [Pseudozyma flocculosa]